MNTCARIAALLLLCCAAARAEGPPRTTSAKLVCGSARLAASTTSIAHVGPADQLVWTGQTITLISGSDAPRALQIADLRTPSSADRGDLPAYVSGWTCLHGTQYVVELWFTCARADRSGICGGQSEWLRFFDVRGQPLDVGFAPQDTRYEALAQKLGVSSDGVALQDAIGE